MAFSATTLEKDDTTIIILKDEASGCSAEIYLFGAILNSFSIPVRDSIINVIDGFSSPEDAAQNITNGFKSAKLSPFVCRMQKGEYIFNGNLHKIDKFYIGDSAIHGLLFNETFTIKSGGVDDNRAFATLAYNYTKKDEGFPFSYHIEVMYELTHNNKLTLSTSVTNTGNNDMPLSDGWHPYFKMGSTVNELFIQFSSKKIVEFSDQLIPNGKTTPYTEFNELKKIEDTFLDNCFVLKDTGKKAACILKDPLSGLALHIIPSSNYPYLQIYTPPHRQSIAIENLSSVPDAFNNGMGLITAKAASEYSFTTSYQLILS